MWWYILEQVIKGKGCFGCGKWTRWSGKCVSISIQSLTLNCRAEGVQGHGMWRLFWPGPYMTYMLSSSATIHVRALYCSLPCWRTHSMYLSPLQPLSFYSIKHLPLSLTTETHFVRTADYFKISHSTVSNIDSILSPIIEVFWIICPSEHQTHLSSTCKLANYMLKCSTYLEVCLMHMKLDSSSWYWRM
jgi:hypothetical protein